MIGLNNYYKNLKMDAGLQLARKIVSKYCKLLAYH